MYHAATGVVSTAGGAATLAYTGAEGTGWAIVAAFALMAAGLALKSLMPKRKRSRV